MAGKRDAQMAIKEGDRDCLASIELLTKEEWRDGAIFHENRSFEKGRKIIKLERALLAVKNVLKQTDCISGHGADVYGSCICPRCEWLREF